MLQNKTSTNTFIKFVNSSVEFIPKHEKKVLNEEKPMTRKIRVYLKESEPKLSTKSSSKKQNKPHTPWFCHYCGGVAHARPNCFKLHANKQATNQKVSVPKAQGPVTLIHELVKALSFFC